jgi:hypothetical protein
MIDEGIMIEVLEALHWDQTGITASLNRVLDIINGYDWLADGDRGSHTYDDDSYYEEIGQCFDAIKEEIETSLHTSGQSHQLCCGKYRSIGRHPKVPLQRRLRMGQLYNEFADNLIDLALIEGEE